MIKGQQEQYNKRLQIVLQVLQNQHEGSFPTQFNMHKHTPHVCPHVSLYLMFDYCCYFHAFSYTFIALSQQNIVSHRPSSTELWTCWNCCSQQAFLFKGLSWWSIVLISVINTVFFVEQCLCVCICMFPHSYFPQGACGVWLMVHTRVSQARLLAVNPLTTEH